MRIPIFDNVQREVDEGSRYSEPDFRYLNRSGRPEMERVRQSLETWIDHYPQSERSRLRSSLRADNTQHRPAVFELALHEALVRSGRSCEVHPQLPNTRRTPDFLVSDSKGDPAFYLEATLRFGQSALERSAEARVNQLYDALDSKVEAPDCFLSIAVEGEPSSNPPIRGVRQFLRQQLEKYDAEAAEQFTWTFSEGDWRIEFQPIPKAPEDRGDPSLRPLGMLLGDVQSISPIEDVRGAIFDKAHAYGSLDLPYVLAVGYEPMLLDHQHVYEALFGTVSYRFDRAQDNLVPVQRKDGAFRGGSGARSRTLSGILIVRFRHASGLGRGTATYYPNPWAATPLALPFEDLEHFRIADDRFEFIEGWPFGRFLGLPETWP